MMKTELPKRKRIRLETYDYASSGAYFVTICIYDRVAMLWEQVGADIIRPQELSKYGRIVESAILSLSDHYENVTVDKYCIMPDHVHMILFIHSEVNGRMISTPTLSTIVGQMKRWVSRRIGFSMWQKSFYDRIIRDEEEYKQIWKYIDENPIKIRIAGEHR